MFPINLTMVMRSAEIVWHHGQYPELNTTCEIVGVGEADPGNQTIMKKHQECFGCFSLKLQGRRKQCRQCEMKILRNISEEISFSD